MKQTAVSLLLITAGLLIHESKADFISSKNESLGVNVTNVHEASVEPITATSTRSDASRVTTTELPRVSTESEDELEGSGDGIEGSGDGGEARDETTTTTIADQEEDEDQDPSGIIVSFSHSETFTILLNRLH